MRKRHAFRPVLEGSLEDRVVLSRIALLHVAPAATVFSGVMSGVSHSFPPVPMRLGSGYTVTLSGTGSINRVAFSVSGSIWGNNTVAPPYNQQSTGSLTLKNARGSLQVTLQGPALNVVQNNNVTVYSFSVTGAKGVYSPYMGETGTASFTLHGVKVPKHMPKTGIPGTFTVKIIG